MGLISMSHERVMRPNTLYDIQDLAFSVKIASLDDIERSLFSNIPKKDLKTAQSAPLLIHKAYELHEATAKFLAYCSFTHCHRYGWHLNP
jgi:hypothetical protein